MDTTTGTNHSDVAESSLARRVRFAAVGALGGLLGSMAGGAATIAGPLGIVLSMAAGAILLVTIGPARN